jgi:branched-chain amino acid transport system permease protein
VGAVAGGVGGAFFATVVGTVSVDTFQFSFSIIVLCAVILGGMGNVWGAITGAVVIEWFDHSGLKWLARQYNDNLGTHIGLHINLPDYEFGLFGLVLVLMMLFRPQGIIPAARARQVRQAEAQVLEHDKLGYGLESGVDALPHHAKHEAQS